MKKNSGPAPVCRFWAQPRFCDRLGGLVRSGFFSLFFLFFLPFYCLSFSADASISTNESTNSMSEPFPHSSRLWCWIRRMALQMNQPTLQERRNILLLVTTAMTDGPGQRDSYLKRNGKHSLVDVSLSLSLDW